jgi:predicted RNA-binding protein with PIN domain
MPRAHLLVDGYNVSKLAWPDQPLTEQRRRLTERLATLAGRTGAEVTCCFDGRESEASGRAPAAPRGVRVLFSQGEIADDLLRRLVRAEPPGRVVVAVTSDRALGADLEAAGARVLPSATLLARLGRV